MPVVPPPTQGATATGSGCGIGGQHGLKWLIYISPHFPS